MTRLSLITQITMIVVAVTIAVMYIKPTVSHIRAVQDTTIQYNEEIKKVSAVNALLAQKKSVIDNNVSESDATALKRYIPNKIDSVAVMKDIVTICNQIGITGIDVRYDGGGNDNGDGGGAEDADSEYRGMRKHTFTVTAPMTYAGMKKLLAALEVNDYLLQIDGLSAAPDESGLLAVEITLATFSLASRTETEKPAVEAVETDIPTTSSDISIE